MTIHFGTDGWRAVISDEFTFDNVRKVAQAIAEKTLADAALAGTNTNAGSNGALAHGSQAHGAQAHGAQTHGAAPSMVVGFDTRFLSDRYAIAVAEVLAANGIDVWLAQADAPTPMISHAIVDKRAQGGVMITASHNPPRYNGIKLKAAYGGSASPAAAKEVERLILAAEASQTPPKRMDIDDALASGRVRRFNPLPAYEAHLRTLVDFERIRRANLSVAFDAMYGTGRIYMRRLLEDAGCTVAELRAEMNPGFNGIHPEPIERHLRPLIDVMQSGRYRIGLATDGDADRIGAVDPTGRFIDPHCIMALLVEYLVHTRHLSGSVVKTVSTTQMLNRLALRYSLPLHETPVGFNQICDLMLSETVLLGGEESGGISMVGHIPEGDGILMGLLLVEMTATSGKTLVQLLDELMAAPDIGPFHYARLDQPVRSFKKSELVKGLMAAAPTTLAGKSVTRLSDLDGVKYILADDSWLLIRPSGTEPVLRIYAESRSASEVQSLLEAGAKMAEALIGAPKASEHERPITNAFDPPG